MIDFQTALSSPLYDYKASGRIMSKSRDGYNHQSASLDFFNCNDSSTGGGEGNLEMIMSLNSEADFFKNINMNGNKILNCVDDRTVLINFSGEIFYNQSPFFLRPLIPIRSCKKLSLTLDLFVEYGLPNYLTLFDEGYFDVTVFGVDSSATSSSKRVTASVRRQLNQYNVEWLRTGSAHTTINVDFGDSPQSGMYIQVFYKILRRQTTGGNRHKVEQSSNTLMNALETTVKKVFDWSSEDVSYTYSYISVNNTELEISGTATIIE
jgi:hypothetical protein